MLDLLDTTGRGEDRAFKSGEVVRQVRLSQELRLGVSEKGVRRATTRCESALAKQVRLSVVDLVRVECLDDFRDELERQERKRIVSPARREPESSEYHARVTKGGKSTYQNHEE